MVCSCCAAPAHEIQGTLVCELALKLASVSKSRLWYSCKFSYELASADSTAPMKLFTLHMPATNRHDLLVQIQQRTLKAYHLARHYVTPSNAGCIKAGRYKSS